MKVVVRVTTLRLQLSEILLTPSVEIPSFSCTPSRSLRYLQYDFEPTRLTFSRLSRLPSVAPGSLELMRVVLQEDFRKAFSADNGSLLEKVDIALNDAKFKQLRVLEFESREPYAPEEPSSLEEPPTLEEITALLQTMLPRTYSRGLLWFRSWKTLGPVIIRPCKCIFGNFGCLSLADFPPVFHVAPDNIRNQFPRFSDFQP